MPKEPKAHGRCVAPFFCLQEGPEPGCRPFAFVVRAVLRPYTAGAGAQNIVLRPDGLWLPLGVASVFLHLLSVEATAPACNTGNGRDTTIRVYTSSVLCNAYEMTSNYYTKFMALPCAKGVAYLRGEYTNACTVKCLHTQRGQQDKHVCRPNGVTQFGDARDVHLAHIGLPETQV